MAQGISRLFGKKSAPSRSDGELTPIELEIKEKCLRIHYQPIVDLSTRRVFAHEGLLRSTSGRFAKGGPPAMFQAAIDQGICGEFGRILRNITMEGCSDTPLFININPNEFDEGWLVRPDDPIFWHSEPVYLEITESVPLSHFELCHSVLKEIRSKGIMLAVDDLGAGFSNLKYISDLSPEIVKLDRQLVAGVHALPRQLMLVVQLTRLCTEMGARVVAEGIETEDELRAVLDAGVHFGQGYLLARPAFPPPKITWPL